jgi:hypothetical protein
VLYQLSYYRIAFRGANVYVDNYTIKCIKRFVEKYSSSK